MDWGRRLVRGTYTCYEGKSVESCECHIEDYWCGFDDLGRLRSKYRFQSMNSDRFCEGWDWGGRVPGKSSYSSAINKQLVAEEASGCSTIVTPRPHPATLLPLPETTVLYCRGARLPISLGPRHGGCHWFFLMCYAVILQVIPLITGYDICLWHDSLVLFGDWWRFS